MIEVEIEDEAWAAALPEVEKLVRTAAEAALSFNPLIPAEAGTQALAGSPRGGGAPKIEQQSDEGAPVQTWVPASAGMSGEEVVTALLTDDENIQDLNARFRGKHAPTNVLSFPAAESARPHLGDIALAYGVCAREANEQGKPLAHHLMHLTVHGVLHLLGYDHETDAEAEDMEGMERAILSGLGVPDPYAHPGSGHLEANA